MQGVPLIASAPVKHEMSDAMSCQGYEVTKYQPPWKMLSEYAMNDSDDCISTPAFQHLVNQVRFCENTKKLNNNLFYIK